jgi:hypothetical protein
MFDLWTIYTTVTETNPLHKSLPIRTTPTSIIPPNDKSILRPKAMVIDIKISGLTHFQIIPIVNNIHANHNYATFKML